jgi:uncharacterized membrane protein HdeD (DUF308 family)
LSPAEIYMSEKKRPVGIIAIVIGLLAASRGASELLEVGRNVDVLTLFVGGIALGAGIVSLVNARKNQ